ncbi:MAG: hypothetical protein ACU84Q_01135 [Gammaproteobacteria bacterium]
MSHFQSSEKQRCELCARVSILSFHHLIPRKVHRRKRFKKHFTKEQLGSGINICQLCHRGIHKLYDEMTLATAFDTKDKLIADVSIHRHISWVKKQKRGLK